MPLPSLFPLWMLNPFAGGTGGGGEIIVELMTEPDIILEPDIQLTLADEAIDIEVSPDIEIEVE